MKGCRYIANNKNTLLKRKLNTRKIGRLAHGFIKERKFSLTKLDFKQLQKE